MNHVKNNSNYFSLDSILASQERIPCKFDVSLYGLGYLDHSKGLNDLVAGSKLDLPCWMVQALSSRKKIISQNLPTAFRKNNREILLADPILVDLHKLGPFFYESGLNILSFAGELAAELGKLLSHVLRERLRRIMDNSLNLLEDGKVEVLLTLDELERSLFRDGQSTLRDHELWISRKSHILTTSSVIEHQKKRKAASMMAVDMAAESASK